MICHQDTFLDHLPSGWSFDRLKDVVALRNYKTSDSCVDDPQRLPQVIDPRMRHRTAAGDGGRCAPGPKWAGSNMSADLSGRI